MAVDLRGKQTELLDYASMAKELAKATKAVANFDSPKEDPVRDKIKAATEEIIVKLDPKASEEEAKDKGWIIDLVESITSRVKGPQKTASEDKGTFESHLSRIADAADYLIKDCSVWVGICGLSATAQKQITSAINMADCCAAVSSAFGKAANRAAKMGATKGLPTATSAAAAAAAGTPNAGGGGTVPPPPPTPPGTAAPGGTPGGPNTGNLAQSLNQGATNAQKFAAGLGLALRGANLLANVFQIIHGQLVNTLGLGFGANVLQGAVQESNMFRENIRQILHQQQGFTAENRAAEKSFHDLDSAVNASGISRVDYQKLWLKNLQRGYVFQEKGDKAQLMAANRMKSTITTAANTAKSLGMDVNATSELFMDWHQHLALSTNDMAEMGRHMKNIARTTGVTGAELQKAMGSAAKMTKALQDAGLASSQALKMATKLAAIAQKHGVGDDFASIQKALSGSKNFQEAPDQVKGMLMRSAMMTGGEVSPEQVRSGAVSGSPQLQRALFRGMEKETRRFLEMGGFGDAAQTMDLTNINEEIQKLQRTAAESTDMEERNRANNSLIALGQLAEQMGTDLGGLQGRMRTVMENQMSSGDRLTKMTNDLNEAMAKGKGGLDATKQLQKQVAETESAALMDALNKTNKALTEAGVSSITELNADAKRNLQERIKEELGADRAQKFLEDAGQSIKDLTSSMTKRATENGLDLQKLAKDKGYANVQALEAALQSNVKDERETALQALGEIDQLVSRKERTSQDPITNIRDTLLDINNWLRSVVESQLFKLTNGVATFIYWTGQAVALLGSIAAAIFVIRNGLSMFGSALSMIRSGGGMAASAAASALGGGAAAVRATPPPLPPGYSPPAAAATPPPLPAAAATTAAAGAAAAVPRATPPPLPAAAATTAATTAAAGAAPAAATAARSRFPRVSGRGALIAAGLAAAGGYLYYKMSGKKDQPSAAAAAGGAEGAMPDNDTVIGLLKQIEINTRGGGGGGGMDGGIPVGHYEEGPEGQIRRPRFGQRPPVPQGPLGPPKAPEEGGGMGSTLATAAALAAPAAAATLLPRVDAFRGVTAPPAVALLDSLPNATASATPAASAAASGGGGFFSRLAGRAGSAWSSVKGAAGSAVEGAKGLAGRAWEGTKSAAGAAGKFVLDKTGLSKVTEWLGQNVKSLVPNFLKSSSGSAITGGLKKVLGKIPVVGTIIESIFTGMRINDIAKSQNMTKEDMYKEMGASVISSGLGLLGGTLAAAMISAPQALGIPSWLLAPLAYMGGDWLGRLVGNAISDYIGGPTLGKAIFDLFYEQAPGGKEAPKAEEGAELEMPPVNDRGMVELAEGGIVTRATRALIGEAGPEAVVPLNNKVINFQNEVLESKFDTMLENFKSVSKFLSMGGVFGTAISGLNKWMGKEEKEEEKSEGFGGKLIKAVEETTKAVGGISFADMGAFAKGEITEAMMQGVQSILKTIGIKEDNEEKRKEQIATGKKEKGKDSSKESSEISDQFRMISKSNNALIDRQSKESDASKASTKAMSAVFVMLADTFRSIAKNSSITTRMLSLISNGMPERIPEPPEPVPSPYAPKRRGKELFGVSDLEEATRSTKTSDVVQSDNDKVWMVHHAGKSSKKVSASYSETGAFKSGEISDAMSEASRKEINEMSSTKEMVSSAISESLKDANVAKSASGSSVTNNTGDSLNSAVERINNSTTILEDYLNDSIVNHSDMHFVGTVDRSLNDAIENIESRNIETIVANAGLFASDHIEGAVDEVANQYLQQQSQMIAEKHGISESIFNAMNARNATITKGDAAQLSAGLFSRDDNISQATDESVSSVVSKVLNSSDMSSFLARSVQEKQELQKKQRILADLSRALNYDTAASDADVSVTGNQTEAMLERGEVATNALDYSDDIQGTVSTLLTNRDSVESYLEREKMGTASANAALLPSMDDIASYLISTQAQKLDEMISLLGDIRTNTAATGGYISDIIGPVAEGLPPMTRPGVKSIAQDYTRGKWDLTFTDSSSSTVTTEGRGGSA